MLFRLTVVGVAALAAGCAPSADLAPPPADLPTAPLAIDYALPPVAAPRLPAALRTDPTPATAPPMDHEAMGHAPAAPAAEPAAHAHVAPAPPDVAPATALRPEALAPALDAYLALHAALAADRFEAGEAAAAALAAAFVQSGVGHELQAHAVAAEAATDLDGLRAAFGRLGPPLVDLLDRVGAPAGVALSAFRCGMADAPEGGVWVQATDDLANPFFGAAMPTCGSATGAPGSGSGAGSGGAHEGHDHGSDHD